MTTATFTTADQNYQNGTTIYWFEMDGETYGVAEGDNEGILDSDGAPIDYNDTLRAEVERECIVTDEIRTEATGF